MEVATLDSLATEEEQWNTLWSSLLAPRAAGAGEAGGMQNRLDETVRTLPFLKGSLRAAAPEPPGAGKRVGNKRIQSLNFEPVPRAPGPQNYDKKIIFKSRHTLRNRATGASRISIDKA